MDAAAFEQLMTLGKVLGAVAAALVLLMKFARIESGVQALVSELKRHTEQEEQYWKIVIDQKEKIGRHTEQLGDHERRIGNLER